MKNIKLTYQVPIKESAGSVEEEFLINGIAISETTTGNNHKFLAEELRSSAGTLKGVPLLADHDNSIDSIKGRVKESNFDDFNSNINFLAKVDDKKVQEMIKDGRINSVSVGAIVKDIEEDEDEGVLIPRGITFKELSLVAVPADSNATFTRALQEAYSLKLDKPMIQMKGGLQATTMEEKNTVVESDVVKSLQDKLAEADAKIKEFEKKERKNLVESYKSLCESRKVDALDVSEMPSAVLEALVSQVKAIKESEQPDAEGDVTDELEKTEAASEEKPEEKSEEEPKEEAEDSDDSEEETTETLKGYKIQQGSGSIRGNAFWISR